MKRKYPPPKKRLGQNFLYDPAIAAKILDAAGVGSGDPVVELGAGRGIMTRGLARLGARLIALELDAALHAALAEELSDYAPAVEVLHVDFTQITLRELLHHRGLETCALIGNIPYNLTRDVLFSFLVDEFEAIDRAYIMVQKEVGDRVVSPPGSRVYGITSVVLQSLYEVKPVFKVAPGSFTPRPKVASVVLEFLPLDEPAVAPDERSRFLHLVKSLFQQRRKTVQNTMKAFYNVSDDELAQVRAETGVDLAARPEQLEKEVFLALSRSLARVGAD